MLRTLVLVLAAVVCVSGCAGGSGGGGSNSMGSSEGPPPSSMYPATSKKVGLGALFGSSSSAPGNVSSAVWWTFFTPKLERWASVFGDVRAEGGGMDVSYFASIHRVVLETSHLGWSPFSLVFELDQDKTPLRFAVEKYNRAPIIDTPVSLAALGEPALRINTAQWQGSFTSRLALIADGHALGWNFQTFGFWNAEGFEVGTVQTASVGAGTPAVNVPTVGSATFSGKLAGLYLAPGASASVATAAVTVNADFGNRSLAFSSSGTRLTADLRTSSAAPHLDLRGTLAYQPASASFTGTLSNAAGTMSGKTRGQYYGPRAEELGGTFALKSTNSIETFVGGYGAKR